jgi:hypothetical protein
MLKIKDGRKHFYQWEINQKLVVGKAAKFVHYYNGIDENALVVDVVDGFADVPNIYLTENWTIHAFAFDGEKVIGAAAFEVVPRAKPDDYVYSQTEVKTWEQLDEKINTLAGFDLNNYYTKAEVDAALADVEVDVDFSNYYTKNEVDSKIENIDVDVDMSNYYTKKEADAAINAAKPDLTGYALKTDIPSLDGYAKTTDIPDVSGFQTAEEVNAAIVAYVGVIENGTY